jgi:hypothetical protein
MAQNLISNVPNIEEEGITIEDIEDTEPFQNLFQDIPDDLSSMADSDDTDDDPDDLIDYSDISAKGLRELQNLQTFFNSNPLQYINNIANMVTTTTSTALQATVYDGSPDPNFFMEARTSTDWPNWKVAMDTEFNSIHEKQVWTIITCSSVPSNIKIIRNRWLYVQKDDDRYRDRTVANGLTQRRICGLHS